MSADSQNRGFQQRMERIESLLESTRQFSDPLARETTQEIVQGLLELHGAALEKLLQTIADHGADGLELIDAAARDKLVGSVLLLHGLHPFDLETRIRQSLENVRPRLALHGGNVELLRIAQGKVRVRMVGDWHSDVAPLILQRMIEEAIFDLAPDVTSLEVDGVPVATQEHESDNPTRIPLPLVHS